MGRLVGVCHLVRDVAEYSYNADSIDGKHHHGKDEYLNQWSISSLSCKILSCERRCRVLIQCR